MSSPVLLVEFGGTNLGHIAQALAGGANMIAAHFSHDAQMASIRGGYERRWEEWKHQENLAEKELAQLNKQIIAAEIRQAVAERELENHERQIENAAEVEAFLRDKYSNERLYIWLQGQVSKVFFQAYKLAYDLARRAERAYRFERGLTESDFIQFGYWDNLRSGLLSGEKLYLDLKRLEAAYVDQNRRELEITKHVSLMLHDPTALIRLKETGRCEVNFGEALYDADFPGHYMRRIKSVSLTIPCVVGPYTSVNCTLTLLGNRTRIKSDPTKPYQESEEGEPDRFVRNFAAIQSVAASHAQNDSGLFELNFRDERYLPFEGAGAESSWRIELMREKELRQFDYDTITDVVFHIKYTARDGGGVLREKAKEALKEMIGGEGSAPLPRLFSARHEFPSEWHRFLTPRESDPNHVLELKLVRERFPFAFRGLQLTMKKLELFLKFKGEVLPVPVSPDFLDVFVRRPGDGPDATPSAHTFSSQSNEYGGLPHVPEITFDEEVGVFGEWRLEVRKSPDVQALLQTLKLVAPGSNTPGQPPKNLSDALEDIYVVCHYAVGGPVA